MIEGIERLDRALEVFAEETRPMLPMRHLRVFLEVCREEGQAPFQLADKVGVSTSAITRIVQELGTWNRKAEPGFKLVDYDVQIADRRFKPVVLTTKGKKLARRITEVIR